MLECMDNSMQASEKENGMCCACVEMALPSIAGQVSRAYPSFPVYSNGCRYSVKSIPVVCSPGTTTGNWHNWNR